MKITVPILLALALVFTSALSKAQSSVEVSSPELSMEGKKVSIAYELINSSTSDLFTVRIEVSDVKNRRINAYSLSGDIGEGVPGGSPKKILWDIETDSIFLDEKIFIEVYAKLETPPVEDLAAVSNEIVSSDPESVPASSSASGSASVKSYNRTAIIMQSLVLPGLGLSRVKGKPHWIRGAVGYGCLGGSIYLNRKAYNSYQDYLDPSSPENANELFDEAYRQDQISKILGFAALGIWVTDLVWTIAATSGMKQAQSSENRKGFSIDTGIEAVSSAPLLTLRYTF